MLTYIWEYQTYTESLKIDSLILKSKLNNVQRAVEDVHSNHQDFNQQVDKWLEEGKQELKITESFLQPLDPPASCWRLTSKCNLKRRYTLATMAESHSKKIKTLMERSLDLKPPPLTPTMASAYRSISSRGKYLEKTMEALCSGDKFVIGLYGSMGVGKSMLIKKLALAIESSRQFNGIAITTASWGETEKAMSYMQSEVAERVGLELVTLSVSDNAKKLKDKLSTMQKVVIIIDNVDKRVDLSRIGIPWPDNDNLCRLVVVSRSLDLCKEMKTQTNVEIEPLSQGEALFLFDELAKENNFTDTTKIKQARDGVLSKFLWTPAEIAMLIRTSQDKQLLPTKSIIAKDGNGKESITLGAEALEIAHIEKPQYWRWLTPCSSKSSLKVAELILVWWVSISAEVREERLSPATNYDVYFVYQLTSRARGFSNTTVRVTVGNSTKLCCLDPLAYASKTSEGVGAGPKRRADGWLEIEMGSFFNVGHPRALPLRVAEDNLNNIKIGLLVRDFELRAQI